LWLAGQMSNQRVPIWAADADLDDDDELNFVIGNYGQNNFEDGALPLSIKKNGHSSFIAAPIHHPHLDEAAVATIQQHMAQQAALSQLPDVVKTVSTMNFHLRLISIHASSSYAFITPSSITTSKKSLLHMRVVGTSTRRNSTPGQNGPRQRSLHL